MAQLAVESDGRRLRRSHNRDAVIDALLSLFLEGNYEPTAADVATRAGLSPRSLFRYFNDLDNLHRAAAQRQLELTMPLVEVAVDAKAPTAAKIEALVATRTRLYELVAPAARAIRLSAPRNQLLANELNRRRVILTDQLAEVFAAELATADDTVLPAIDVLCTFESYELLRYYQGLSQAAAKAALSAALTALLGA